MTWTVQTALTSIEVALRDAILDGLGKTATVATLTALRALPSAGMGDGRRVFVTAAALRYRFSRYSTAADNGSTVIKPADNPTAGRWLATASTSASGYLKAVELYEGDRTPEALLIRLQGAKPGVVIVYDSDEFSTPSTVAGSVYKNTYNFTILCISSNLRSEHQTAIGSAIATEAAADPGVNAITGDLISLLAGHRLGLADGVMWTEIVGRSREATVEADRLMVYGVRIRVYASVHIVESDDGLVDLGSLSVQRQLAAGIYDASNYVSTTAILATGSSGSLTVPVASGKVNGTAVTSAATSRTFTASRLTYRDLSSAGVWSFVEVAPGHEPAAVASTKLRVAVTETDSGGLVLSDVILAPSLVDFGDPDILDVT